MKSRFILQKTNCSRALEALDRVDAECSMHVILKQPEKILIYEAGRRGSKIDLRSKTYIFLKVLGSSTLKFDDPIILGDDFGYTRVDFFKMHQK